MDITIRRQRRIFISYSRDDSGHARDLHKHLAEFRNRNGEDAVFFDQTRINSGEQWSEVIGKNLESADAFVLLVSKNFLSSDYCVQKEAGRALERKLNGEVEIFLVLLAACKFEEVEPKPVTGRLAFGRIQFAGPVRPEDGRLLPLEQWPHPDPAWTEILDKIYRYYKIGAPAAAPPSLAAQVAATETRDRLRQLIFLCDRGDQCDVLDGRLATAPPTARPFFAVSHGSDDDRPKQLVHRFERFNIPKYLRERGILVKPLLEIARLPRKIQTNDTALTWYSANFFEKAGWTGGSPKDLSAKLAADPRPKFFFASLMTDDPAEAVDYQRQVSAFLAELSDLPLDRPLFVLLVFKHSLAQTEAFKTSLSLPEQSDRVLLPPLAPVIKREIDNWFTEWEEAFAQVENPAGLKQALFRRHDEMSQQRGGLPMEQVIALVEDHAGIKMNIL